MLNRFCQSDFTFSQTANNVEISITTENIKIACIGDDIKPSLPLQSAVIAETTKHGNAVNIKLLTIKPHSPALKDVNIL
jgi:hypothetical protein